MVIFTIAVLSVLAATNARIVYDRPAASAASEAQIKFAIENKYDQTGPGAKEPDYAYKTFKNIEDALLGYINDPDTKLPDSERIRAYHKLYNNNNPVTEHHPKFQHKPPILITRYSFPNKKVFYHEPQSELGILDLRGMKHNLKLSPEPYKIKKVHLPKNPLSLSHYTREHDDEDTKHDPNPHYTYSYGVHDRHTGDSKSAHETRDGGTVKGYYTVVDADGKQRTVHYTADDKQGFRAVVHRTPTNTHGPS